MTPVYYPTAPAPLIPGTDAVFQEINMLAAHFNAQTLNLYPLSFPTRWFPPMLLGMHCQKELAKLDKAGDLHHVYHPLPRIFPILRNLAKPIVYSVIAGLDCARKLPAKKDMALPAAWIVGSTADADKLLAAGARKCRVIRPGINLQPFLSVPPPPVQPPFTILAGSAPWVPAQFHQKGFELLLNECAKRKDMKLILLWRGRMEPELRRKINALAINDQVEVVNQHVNVSEYLAKAHAAIVLADQARVVKSFPHSLIEALAAGRPVLVSRCIPMSEYVQENNCGTVLDDLTPESFDVALEHLRANYNEAAQLAKEVAARDFSTEQMISEVQSLYSEVLDTARVE